MKFTRDQKEKNNFLKKKRQTNYHENIFLANKFEISFTSEQ